MSFASKYNDLKNKVNQLEAGARTIIQKGKTSLENKFGTVATQVSHLFDGGFVGMDANGAETFDSVFSSYIEAIQAQINGFDAEGNFAIALKGTELEAAVTNFIQEVKALLNAYVSSLWVEELELVGYFAKLSGDIEGVAPSDGSESVQAMAAKVAKDAAADIRETAKNIDLDGDSGATA